MALALIMVGLPARGKTYTARKIARYLSWLGSKTRVFNVGNYRRELSGASVPHQFFDPSNKVGLAARRKAAEAALKDMVQWFNQGGEVGVFDATNSTIERRKWLLRKFDEAGVEVAMIESLCDDDSIVDANIQSTKLGSPDYVGVGIEAATTDFRSRIAHYVKAYQPLKEENVPWIKIIDAGRQVVLNRLEGPLLMRVGYFLMHLNLLPNPIWLSRHGQSIFNTQDRVGGDSALSPNGRLYAQSLADFMQDQPFPEIWTSTLQRTIQTAARVGRPIRRWKLLDEIQAGICDGLTYREIEERYPEIYARRQQDKLRYRYPQGESYEDVIQRLDPLILALEHRREPVLVVAHQAILRAVYGYFTNKERTSVPYIGVQLHTLIYLRPSTYGCEEMKFSLPPHLENHH